MKNIKLVVLVAVLFLMNGQTFAQSNELLGAGATFPYPLYSKMFNVYSKTFNVKVNYQSIGSGGGIRQLLNKTVDFGATDAFMKDAALAKAPAEIVHIPIVLGAVTVTYNLVGSPEVKLTPDVLSEIFLGDIKKWNDPKIVKDNGGIKLPNQNIVVVHRSDGSGTTNIFTDYLAKVSSDWKTKVGVGKSVNWPTGLGAKGNEGVAGLIKQIPGSIGYVELAYTIQNKMPTAKVQNKSGNYIKPSIETISMSAAGEIPTDTRVSITDTDSENGYPISGFTWIIAYKEQMISTENPEKAKVLVDLLWWMTHEGQKYASPLDYAPLPEKLVQNVESLLKSFQFKGKGVR